MTIKTVAFSICLLFLAEIVLSQNWVQLADFPSTERDDGTFFVIGNNAYCGTGLKTGWVPSADMHAFNFQTESWQTIQSLPAGMERQYASGFSNGQVGFKFGGVSGSNYFNDLWMLNPATGNWQEKTSLPSVGRQGMCNFVINDTAYIIGGLTANSTAISEVWAYSFTADSWIFKGNLPFGERWRGAATTHQNKGYVLFGRNAAGAYTNDLYEYNQISNEWNWVSTFPEVARLYSTLQSVDGHLVVFAGVDSLQTSYNDIWSFNVETSTWNELNALPSDARRGGMCFVNESTIYYTTGINQANTRLKETWKINDPILSSEGLEYSNFIVFPNPTSDFIYITFETFELQATEINITNVAGQLMKKFDDNNLISDHSIAIDLSDLVSGIYLLNFDFKEERFTKRIIKK